MYILYIFVLFFIFHWWCRCYFSIFFLYSSVSYSSAYSLVLFQKSFLVLFYSDMSLEIGVKGKKALSGIVTIKVINYYSGMKKKWI